VLKLVTTASIPQASALNFLRGAEDARDIGEATTALEKAALESLNKTTEAWRQKFLQLSPAERSSLLSAVTIDDSSPRARDVGQVLAQAVRLVAPRGKSEIFVAYLLGWWYRVCVQLLDGSLPAISADDLEQETSDLRDQFLPDNLPLAPEVLVPFSEEDSLPYRDRQFVQQLMWIALDEERLWSAIRDYHRAWTQRSEWLRLNLISEPELDRFAFQLFDEWEHIFYERVAKMRRDGEPADEISGQEILERVSAESRARVRERFTATWLSRGTFHALADGWSNRIIGWHPEFPSKLAGLLAEVAQ